MGCSRAKSSIRLPLGEPLEGVALEGVALEEAFFKTALLEVAAEGVASPASLSVAFGRLRLLRRVRPVSSVTATTLLRSSSSISSPLGSA